MSLCEALSNQLTASVDVGAGLEDHHDRGQPGQRFRSDHVHALDPVEQVLFQRNSDQLLDFLSGEAQRLGLNLRVRWAELRQHLQRCAAKLHDANRQDADSGCQD